MTVTASPDIFREIIWGEDDMSSHFWRGKGQNAGMNLCFGFHSRKGHKPKVDFGDPLGSALQWREKSANGLESP
ncbi:hypothetical protein WBQ88_20595 [Sphingopyxis sp. CCNWLW253]|uniref:hypothetical protein n=1 Tax=unclassified Sphingopyxis TaxID=2614943 RepID=UPI003012A291